MLPRDLGFESAAAILTQQFEPHQGTCGGDKTDGGRDRSGRCVRIARNFQFTRANIPSVAVRASMPVRASMKEVHISQELKYEFIRGVVVHLSRRSHLLDF